MSHITLNTVPDIDSDTEIAWLRLGESESYDATLYLDTLTLVVDCNVYDEDLGDWRTERSFVGKDAEDFLSFLNLDLYTIE